MFFLDDLFKQFRIKRTDTGGFEPQANGDAENRIGLGLVTARGLLLQCGGDVFV